MVEERIPVELDAADEFDAASATQESENCCDWRQQFRERPVALGLGALAIGTLVGYGVAATLKGRSRRETQSAELSGSQLAANEEDELAERHSAFHGHSYAAQPIIDGSHEEFERVTDEAPETEGEERGASYQYSAPIQRDEDVESKKPGLLGRFKETSAYDRLQTELSTIGDRFVDELSKTAQDVVLPAIFAKIHELIGMDLSQKKRQPEKPKEASEPASPNASTGSAEDSQADASHGASYATSENLPYSARSSRSQSGGGESILDLER